MSAASLLPFMILMQASPGEEPATAPPIEGEAEEPARNQSIDRDGLNTTAKEEADELDNEIIEGRERPGFNAPLPERVTQENPGAVRAPPPQAFSPDQVPIPDRWRLIDNVTDIDGNPIIKEALLDPYNQNTYKGDRPINPDKVPWLPIKENDWFFVLNAISDTVYEPRTFPIPVGIQTTEDPDRLDVFGNDFSTVLSQTFIVGAALLKGSTAYKPPSIEYRLTLAYNVNYVDVPERRVLFVEPSRPSHRLDHFLGVQEAFILSLIHI